MKFEKPEDRVFLTIDTYTYMDLMHLRQDFGDVVHAVKLGVRFVRSKNERAIRGHLQAHGVDVFYDGKFSEISANMVGTVDDYSDDGYSYMSVNASVEKEALFAAAIATRATKIVAAVQPNQPKTLEDQLDKIDWANRQLGKGDKIDLVMCDVADLKKVRDAGDFAVIATGIALPDTELCEVGGRVTPAQAIDGGADYLAIGRAVTAAPDRMEAMRKVLENIASAA